MDRVRYLLLMTGLAATMATCTSGPSPIAQGRYVTVSEPVIEQVSEQTYRVQVPVKIREGYHIQANPASEPYLIPSTLSINRAASPVHYPAGALYRLEGSDLTLSVYDGEVQFDFVVEIDEPAVRGIGGVTGSFRYQACDHRTCFPPEVLDLVLQGVAD